MTLKSGIASNKNQVLNYTVCPPAPPPIGLWVAIARKKIVCNTKSQARTQGGGGEVFTPPPPHLWIRKLFWGEGRYGQLYGQLTQKKLRKGGKKGVGVPTSLPPPLRDFLGLARPGGGGALTFGKGRGVWPQNLKPYPEELKLLMNRGA